MNLGANKRKNEQLRKLKVALYQSFASTNFPNRACGWTRATLAQPEVCGNAVTCVKIGSIASFAHTVTAYDCSIGTREVQSASLSGTKGA